MKSQLQNALSWTLHGMLWRVVVALLLVLLAVPVFHLGIFVTYALCWQGFAFEPILVLLTLAPVLVFLNALGTILSFRHSLVLAGALAVSYLGGAFILSPLPALVPDYISYWAPIPMLAILCMFASLCLNLAWIAWSLRGHLAARREC
ncbi:MAG: hypothetical protein OXD31_18010 [Chloroflexi bacterium]|nr:hypothetical protein [Chloroflexota bacterium]